MVNYWRVLFFFPFLLWVSMIILAVLRSEKYFAYVILRSYRCKLLHKSCMSRKATFCRSCTISPSEESYFGNQEMAIQRNHESYLGVLKLWRIPYQHKP